MVQIAFTSIRPCTRVAVLQARPRSRPSIWRRIGVTTRAVAYADEESAAGKVVIEVLPTEDDVSQYLVKAVEDAAQEAIAARGIFTLAIPGGSVLKALAGLASQGDNRVDWSATRLFFVNHKCVPRDDPSSSCFKARDLFLNAMQAPETSIVDLQGSDNAQAEAEAYETLLRGCSVDHSMELSPSSGAPRFDLVLLGVGADGHVGSLYPGMSQPLATDGWVLPVVKAKPPPSITLSLPVMNAARRVVVCLTGAKKADAARTALETPAPPGEFPAQMVQPDAAPAVWLMDEAAAAGLKVVQQARAAAVGGE